MDRFAIAAQPKIAPALRIRYPGPVDLDVHPLAPGSIIAGDFRVIERLAEGGMGSVYVVEQRSTRRRRGPADRRTMTTSAGDVR